MKLITIPIVIIILFCIFAVFTPVLLLQASEPVLSPEIRVSGAEVLAEISSFLGRYDSSIELYDYLIGLNPDSAQYYGKKGHLLQITGRPEEALSALDGAIARDKENPDYLLKKARLTRSLKQTDVSGETYARIDQISPKNAQEFVLCGDAALDRGMYLRAYENYSRAVSANPSDGATWEKFGDVIFTLLTIYTGGLDADEKFKEKDLYKEGLQSYENAIRLNPSKENEIRLKLEKRSDSYMPHSIAELESRYTRYRYLG